MDTKPKYDLPWELISASFTETLREDEKLQLQEWLDANVANQNAYSKLEELWKSGLQEYAIYRMANEHKAWDALKFKMGKTGNNNPETKIINARFAHMPLKLKYLMAIASVFLGLVVLWIFLNRNNYEVYEADNGLVRMVILKDSSTVVLKPGTWIKVSKDYNKTNRNIIMSSGEADFEVKHKTTSTFIVELGTTQIKDIGTSFSIKKDRKEINVTVTSGKVAFVKVTSNETRELTAGKNITFDIEKGKFGEVKSIENTSKANEQSLKFDNTSLSDAIVAIQKVYGKKIKLGDAQIADHKITAQLDGMPYNKVMQVICKSLGLEYSISDSVYILSKKKSEQH
jgi:transmembrane sensor